MSSRRPRLPMFLGLAVLTAMTNFLLFALHAFLHAGLAVPIGAFDALVMGLLAMGPIAGVALMLRGRPRHGAAIYTLLMLISLGQGLWGHYAEDTPDNTYYAPLDTWGQLYVGTAFMQIAFAIQGLSGGVVLLIKPEQPRPRNAEIQPS